jgi:CRP-like cAMP-binding protein
MLDFFRNDTDFRTFGPGATVFANGDRGDAMFVIVEGQVDLFLRGKLLETFGPGEVIGEMALIDASPRVASAVARTASKLVPVSEKRFLSMVQQTPQFSLEIMRLMAARLRKMNSSRR